ncbi:glycerol-3-phosphate 1-O-acyltransferase PlsY [Sporosalibacterium faouarense]|uniref:glycerol-3-phosphate 1-O-acyltransferase PlsY n=1 Tax=Sporosalibacterium faouarense TaxID=516123 RepID=UPI00192BF8C7|nr:glycerol-3-phosphate 1-O-acyltransferase PlsY [Sporosalibacterium faouarense]
MLDVIIIILIGYLLGSFASSFFLGKMFKKIDIREHGSGNAGATNALRVFGAKLAAITFILDILKGVVAVIIGRYILGESGALIAGVSAVIGHNWPVFLGFKGGKGVATTIAIVMAIEPIIAIISVLIGLIVIIRSKYVSLGSITGMAVLPIVSLIIIRPFDIKFFVFALVLGLMSIYRHRSNIKRLLKGNESKIGQKA